MNGKLFMGLLLICLALWALGCAAPGAAEKPLSEVEKAALRAADIAACQNLMSLHSWYHSAFLNDVELEKIWVKKTPDPVWAQNTNYWRGMAAIKAYYGPTTPKEQKIGQIQWHTITSGVVEIAGDRKTAKGVWYTPGVIGRAGADGKQSLTWMWERYGIDFANEDGQWKIWHLHVYTDFAASMSGSAGGPGGPPPGAPPAGPGANSAKAEKFGRESGPQAGGPSMRQPSSYSAKVGYKEFGKDTPAALIPRPPEPYRTFSETYSYADPDEYLMFVDYKELKDILKNP